MRTQAERIAAVETELKILKKSVESIDRKMDDLLALRNKGVGVFWLASVIFGTSLAAAITYFLSWFKGA